MKVVAFLLKAMALCALLLFTAIVFGIFYMPHYSRRVAQDFCGSINLNDDIASLIRRANASNIKHVESKDSWSEDTSDHDFWTYGTFGNYSSCVATTKRNKVVSKQVVNHVD
jgi:hypothetical protein